MPTHLNSPEFDQIFDPVQMNSKIWEPLSGKLIWKWPCCWELSPGFSLGRTRLKSVLSSHTNAKPIKTREFLNHRITLVHLISQNGQCHLQQRKMKNCSHVTNYSNQNKIKRSVTICALGSKLFRGRTYSWTQLVFTSYPDARNLITLLILCQLL